MRKEIKKSAMHSAKRAQPVKKIKCISETKWYKEKMKRGNEILKKFPVPEGW
jgi:hypothetical protein